MNEETKQELDNFARAVKRFVKMVATELPRFKGEAEGVEKACQDLSQSLKDRH